MFADVWTKVAAHPDLANSASDPEFVAKVNEIARDPAAMAKSVPSGHRVLLHSFCFVIAQLHRRSQDSAAAQCPDEPRGEGKARCCRCSCLTS